MPITTAPGSTTDFMIEVAKGSVAGHSLVHKFGRNSAVSTTLVPVCDGGFYRTPVPSAAVTLAVISDDANDTAAGTGAREVTLVYLDATGSQQTGTIATNGLTESTGTITGVWRLLRAWISSSGTYASQTAASQNGTITIRVASAGATWGSIPEVGTTGFAVGQSLIGCYTVPLGKTAYILSSILTVDSNKTADLYFFKRENSLDESSPYSGVLRIQNVYTGIVGVHEITHTTHESYPALTDMGWMAVAASAADVSAEFELLLVDD